MLLVRSKRGINFLAGNVIYIIFVLLFLFGVGAFVFSQQSGANIWEEYYVSEVVKLVNLAENGDEIQVDIQKATEIAKRNKVANLESLFRFNNEDKEVCVKLSRGRQTCRNYFNNVNVESHRTRFGVGEGERNVFVFNVVEDKE